MKLIQRFKKEKFLFEELVKRDFKQKYKRSILGMFWSILYPLLTLLVMSLVFTHFFGSDIEHYIIYLFIGNLVFNYFKESTIGGMNALTANAYIFSKVNVPKYLFVLSKNISALINFGLTLVIFFVFVAFDQVPFSFSFFGIIYPIILLIIFNIGMGMILSALYMFFRDISYLYEVFTMLLMYMSAIFYSVDTFPSYMHNIFLLNPIYCYIKYIRVLILDGSVPSIQFIGLCTFYALLVFGIGCLIYKKCNHKFLYYV
jgi:ABC-2 type transport system permease protein